MFSFFVFFSNSMERSRWKISLFGMIESIKLRIAAKSETNLYESIN